MEPFWSCEQHFVRQEVKVFHYPLKMWNCLLIFEGALIPSVTYSFVSRRIMFIVGVLPYEMFNQSFFHPLDNTSTVLHRIIETNLQFEITIYETYNHGVI